MRRHESESSYEDRRAMVREDIRQQFVARGVPLDDVYRWDADMEGELYEGIDEASVYRFMDKSPEADNENFCDYVYAIMIGASPAECYCHGLGYEVDEPTPYDTYTSACVECRAGASYMANRGE